MVEVIMEVEEVQLTMISVVGPLVMVVGAVKEQFVLFGQVLFDNSQPRVQLMSNN
jgi:hypothetical protein